MGNPIFEEQFFKTKTLQIFLKNSKYIALCVKTAFRNNFGPLKVPKLENPHFHFHVFSGWGSSVRKNWTPVITKKVDPSLTGEGINTHIRKSKIIFESSLKKKVVYKYYSKKRFWSVSSKNWRFKKWISHCI